MYYETNVILCKIVSILYICKLMLNYQLFSSVCCFLFLFVLFVQYENNSKTYTM